MITKCRFCDYQKSTPLDLKALKKAANKDIPFEDYLMFMEQIGLPHSDYTSVKIHMGIKHKEQAFKYISPETIFEDAEKEVIDETT